MTSILRTDSIQSTSGTTAATIDSNGRVNRSNIPYIQLLKDSNLAASAGATLTDWRVRQSNDITHSNGVLTVPVDGLYHVGVSLIANGSSGLYLNVNGTNQFRIGYADQGTSETWSAVSGDCILYLNANDTIRLNSEDAVNWYGHTGASTVSSYYCYLIG